MKTEGEPILSALHSLLQDFHLGDMGLNRSEIDHIIVSAPAQPMQHPVSSQ